MIIFKETIDGQDVFEKSPNYSAILKEQTDLPPEQYKVLENLFADVKNYVQNANNKRTKRPKVCIKQSHIDEFRKLWNTINRESFYTIDNLDDKAENELAKQIADEIATIYIDAVLLQTIRRELDIKNLDGSDAIKKDLKETETLRSKIDYLEFVRQLSGESHTPINFIIKIFNALPSDFKSKMISNNPAQALKEMKDIIEKNLMGSIKARIEYNTLDGHISSNELHEESGTYYLKAGSCGKFQEDISGQFRLKEKWIFEDVIEYDSDTEKIIILQDPEIDSIELFGKLPRLKIKTPLGDYNPDFCYAIKGNNAKNLFLIVESKGYDTMTKIPPKEKEKIDFAKKHFEKLNELYKNSNIEISYRERINATQLAQLINDTINQ
jgi:type III restriction enzyme